MKAVRNVAKEHMPVQVEPTKMTMRYALALVAASTLTLLGVVAYLLATGHGLLMEPDGLALYYTFFTYEGTVLRDALAALASGTAPYFPQFTFDLGYGADILATMSGTVNNPFSLTSVFFPPEISEFGYYFGIWLRVEFVAFAFSLYCFNRGKAPAPTLIGTLSYLTCGFMIYWSMLRHPGFMMMAGLLPLTLLGADKLFSGGRPAWLVVSIAVSFFTSVYFTYMVCLFLLGYCLIKYFFAPRDRSVADFVKLVARFAACLLLGFAMGAICGIPTIMQMTSMGRVTQSVAVPLLFDPIYYAALPAALTGTYVTKRGLYLGTVSLFMVAVFLLCGKRFDPAERKPWLVALGVITVLTCIPWFGYMLNGFGYVSDRWMALSGFCLGYVTCLTVPVLGKLERHEWRRILIVMGIVMILALAAALLHGSLGAIPMTIVPALLIGLVVVTQIRGIRSVAAVMACAFIFCGTCAAAVYCSPIGKSYEDSFGAFGDAYRMMYEVSPARAVKDASDSESRFSTAISHTTQANSSLLLNEKGISIFSSFYNQPVDDFRDVMGVSSNHVNFIYSGNDGRLALDGFSGARYLAATSAQSPLIPATYKPAGVLASGYNAYETDVALPLAFTYDHAISQTAFNDMSMAERQEAILSGCVLADKDISGTIVEPDVHAQPCPVTMQADKGIVVEDGKIIVSSTDAKLTLSFDGVDNSETYLSFENLMFEGLNPGAAIQATGGTRSSSPKALVKDVLYVQPGEFTITTKVDGHTKKTKIDTTESNKWVGRTNWIINLGYRENALREMTLEFSQQGIYTFDSLQVECQPVQPVVESLTTLGKAGASDISFRNDTASALFHTGSEGGYAFFSLPYSKGWSATLDGKPADILRADVGFMAVRVDEPGDHEVILTYNTPGLKLGAVISLCGIALFVILVIAGRIFRNRSARSSS